MARPRIDINWDEFDKLCGIHATQTEIACWFRCSPDTIDRAVQREKNIGFADYYAQKSSTGKISLRRKQFELAMKGDKTMLIWLGKQYLGQADKVEQASTIMIEAAKEFETLSTQEKIARLEQSILDLKGDQ